VSGGKGATTLNHRKEEVGGKSHAVGADGGGVRGGGTKISKRGNIPEGHMRCRRERGKDQFNQKPTLARVPNTKRGKERPLVEPDHTPLGSWRRGKINWEGKKRLK